MSEDNTKSELTYDSTANIVINTAKEYWNTPEPSEYSAFELTGMFRTNNQLQEHYNRSNVALANVREYLIENANELDEHADEIARILGIDLSTDVEFKVNVSFNVTLTLPIGVDPDSIDATDFDFEITSEYDIVDYNVYPIYCNEQ